MINTTLCYIRQKGRCLMLHRVKKENDLNQDKWIGVGGKFEDKESPEDCLLREVREETGLAIRLLDGFRESVEYFPKPGVKKQVVYFLGEALGDELVPQEEEISELIWTPLLEAAGLVTFANDKRLIRLAKRRLGLPEEPSARRRPCRRPGRRPNR